LWWYLLWWDIKNNISAWPKIFIRRSIYLVVSSQLQPTILYIHLHWYLCVSFQILDEYETTETMLIPRAQLCFWIFFRPYFGCHRSGNIATLFCSSLHNTMLWFRCVSFAILQLANRLFGSDLCLSVQGRCFRWLSFSA
jgi:hypothetical protein